MTLLAILLGTLIAGVGSVWLAAALSFGLLARYTQHMLSLAAGALLAVAFMNLLPEAFESQHSAKDLFMTLLGGLLLFFLLDKAELWHHGHEHRQVASADAAERQPQEAGHDAHEHGHHGPQAPVSGSWAVLAGDTVHCVGDGLLIASAFVADLRLGVVASLAVLMHEVPHHMGDLALLRHLSSDRKVAVVKVSLAGATTALGGLAGYWLVDSLRDYLPYFLVVASSSFVYVALADLIPQLQKRLGARQTLAQIAWLALGVALVTAVGALAPGH